MSFADVLMQPEDLELESGVRLTRYLPPVMDFGVERLQVRSFEHLVWLLLKMLLKFQIKRFCCRYFLSRIRQEIKNIPNEINECMAASYGILLLIFSTKIFIQVSGYRQENLGFGGRIGLDLVWSG